MIKFTTQELEMESNLKQRIEFIGEFAILHQRLSMVVSNVSIILI